MASLEDFDWEDVDDLLDAYNGAYGDEAEAVAAQIVEHPDNVVSATNGQFGERFQEEAQGYLDYLEETGGLEAAGLSVVYEDEGDNQEQYEDPDDALALEEVAQQHPDDPQYAEDLSVFENEIRRVESAIGRTLTGAEEKRLIAAVPEDGPIPDLAEKFAAELSGRTGDREGRRGQMAERAADMIADAQHRRDAEAPAEEPPEKEGEVDLRSETTEERRARMEQAANQVKAETEHPEPALTPAGHATEE
jgi:hypothetical protein